MTAYTIKTTNIYRVSTPEDALALREYLIEHESGTLSSFTYTTKYLKSKGEIVDEWQQVKAVFDIDSEKEPDGNLPVYVSPTVEEVF